MADEQSGGVTAEEAGPGLRCWWGSFELPLDTWACWCIGPMRLWARRTTDEYRLAWERGPDRLADALEIVIPADPPPDTGSPETVRFAFARTGRGLRLTPRLADLPIVVRPDTPLWIPPGQKTTLYLGTITWLAVAADETPDATLIELPIYRPSDTWFGADTLSGELCYASRTRARTRLEFLTKLPQRAITPVEILNHGSDMLNVQQLRIPLPALSLYAAGSGDLWTDGIRFTRSDQHDHAEFDLLGKSGHVPAGAQRLAEARSSLQRNTVIRAFNALFG